MLSTIIVLLLSGCILLLPVAFWMYIFTSFFPYGVSRKQFLIGMLSWAVATVPFVYREGIFSGNILREIFFHLSLIHTTEFPLWLFYSILTFFAFMCVIVFLISYLFQEKKKRFIKVFTLVIIFLIILIFLSIQEIIFFSDIFPHGISGIFLRFGDLLFVSVGSIISYYIIISILEEWMKYIASLTYAGKLDYFKVFQKYICLTACIALGFSFFENILYVWSFISQHGVAEWLLPLVFFRSIFAIILHLMTSMLFALAFWHIFHLSKKYVRQIILFFLIASLALVSHVFFDASLTFGYMGYIFFYIIAIYFFISYLSVSFSNE